MELFRRCNRRFVTLALLVPAMSLWVAAPAHAVTLFDGVIFVDDFVLAFGGDDSVNGQSGDDFLDGDTGTNRLDGGAGIDECVNGPVLVNCEW